LPQLRLRSWSCPTDSRQAAVAQPAWAARAVRPQLEEPPVLPAWPAAGLEA
jgi:hypothetical protein